jgi:hypothetical protein
MLSPVRNVHCLGVPIIAIALFDALTFRWSTYGNGVRTQLFVLRALLVAVRAVLQGLCTEQACNDG